MAVKSAINRNNDEMAFMPMLKPIELMSKISGIGINKLRELMDNGEIEYVQFGNKRLLTEGAILDWYNRNKVAVTAAGKE